MESKARDLLVKEFISALEQGHIPWEKPWRNTDQYAYNASSGNRYSGINDFILAYKMMAKGYEDPRWVTFKQAKELGWKMKGPKGTQKGTHLEFWAIYDRVQHVNITEKEEERLIDAGRNPRDFTHFSKHFVVFNAEQFENVPELEKKDEVKTPINSNEIVDRMGENMGLEFIHFGNRAFYSPMNDTITLPPKDNFKDDYSYNATKLHEMAHATGHSSRLHRDLSGQFGSVEYAKEELRAEISSSFLMGDLGYQFDSEHVNNHSAYIKNWINILNTEPKELFNAIKDAHQIADYLKEKGGLEVSRDVEQPLEETQGDQQVVTEQVITEQTINLIGEPFRNEWAKIEPIPIENPSKVVVFDTETTGFDELNDEILQFSAIDGDGNVLLNEYIKPSYHTEWQEAMKVNKITPEMLQDKPTMAEVAGKIKGVMESADTLIAYNNAFDLKMLRGQIGYSVKENLKQVDVMKDFAPIYGEYNEVYGNYKWKSLVVASQYYGFDWSQYPAHNSLGDVYATMFVHERIEEHKERVNLKKTYYKEYLKEKLEDSKQSNWMFKGDMSKAIYRIDDIVIDGGFVNDKRSVLHENLYEKDPETGINYFEVHGQRVEFELSELADWGAFLIPEEKQYISSVRRKDLEDIGFERMSMNNNVLVGNKVEQINEMGVPNQDMVTDILQLDENKKILLSMPEERRERFFAWRQSLYDDGLSQIQINEIVQSSLNRFVDLQNYGETKITESVLVSQEEIRQEIPLNRDLTYPDEVLNKRIMVDFVIEHVMDGEKWDLYEEGSTIIMNMDGREMKYESYSELIEEWKDTIERDINTSLPDESDNEIIEYLGIEIEDPDFRNQFLEENRSLSETRELEEKANETVQDKEENEKKDVVKHFSKVYWRDVANTLDKNIPITDVFERLGFTVVPDGRGTFTTNEHDSLKMWTNENDASKNGHFKWYSQDIGGGVTKAYMTFKNVDFKTAVSELLAQYNGLYGIDGKNTISVSEDTKPAPQYKTESDEVKLHKLKQALLDHKCQNTDMKQVFAYLHKTRGIDPEIIQLFIDRKCLYQGQDDSKYHNPEVVFTTKNENGIMCGAFHRSCNSQSKYRGTYSGSDESRGWFFEPTAEVGFNWAKKNEELLEAGEDPIPHPYNIEKPLLVFEANIEMMSYMTILKEASKTNPALDYRNFAYLSTNGIAKSECIEKTCELYGYDKVYVMFNNDFDKEKNAGKEAALNAVKRLSEQGIQAEVHLPAQYNDWNDTLLAKRNEKNKMLTNNKEMNKNVKVRESR